ncbi:ABC transporter permease subunit [Niveispirillum sp.]|uniref:ABC transporter permease subunit n=1 Tax=Niveispirillum sp. TaxID=1917217 RepID=UPI001B6F0D3C|nr:ABC transporter permease subunit [Niveispirillum sp.]MBP7337631.1 ABC transporter permease subunit [Niveispirillum sp.]
MTTPFLEFWSHFRRNRGAVLGLFIVLALSFVAIFADIVAPYDPAEQFRDFVLLPPAWIDGGNWAFPLGTDDIGRDMLSRLIHGARLSLFIGLLVVTLSLAVGVALGLLAGFYGGASDTLIARFMDILLSLPSLLLAIVVAAILGPGLVNAAIAVSVVIVPHYARLTRASVMAERGREYVTAARLAGASDTRLMLVTILPNCAAPLIVQATLGFSTAILDAAALGFLGLGAQPPTPEWGTMLSSSLQFLQRAWWVVTFPGLSILITVLAFNLMGDGLRDALDPKLKR